MKNKFLQTIEVIALIGLILLSWMSLVTPARSSNHPVIDVDLEGRENIYLEVNHNTTSLPVLNGTVRNTSPWTYQTQYWVPGTSSFVQGHDTVDRGTTPYGYFYLQAAVDNCTSDVHYKCPPLSFTPNLEGIKNIPLGRTAIVLIYVTQDSYTNFASTRIHITRDDLKMSWADDTTSTVTAGSNIVDSYSANIKGYFNNESDMVFELWIQEGAEEVQKLALTKSEVNSSWAGTEWYYQTKYGEWMIQSFSNCPSVSDNSKCSQVRFVPTSNEINNLNGKNVMMRLRGSRILGNQAETEVLNFTINGHPSVSYDWIEENSETIVTGNQLEFNEIFGSASIFKLKESAFSFDATERLDQISQLFEEDGGISVTISDFTATPLGASFKYGKWFVEEFSGQDDLHNNLYESNSVRFAFRPNTTAINNILNTDENIISTLNLHIHQGDESTPKITTTTITVTIDRSSVKPILTITSKTNTVVEGQKATFIITSNVDPIQPFFVSYIPTNSSGNFLDTTTFPSGYPQFENLTFSQAEGSDAWTDEIDIELRKTDGIDTEDGSITVTLNTATEYAFYFVAAEPDNSVTIRVKDAEYPTLSFAENSYSVTEEDTDTNVELTLNLSEAINDAVNGILCLLLAKLQLEEQTLLILLMGPVSIFTKHNFNSNQLSNQR